ncbi:hypothetical protein ACERII_08995 [Evansella sp. AB-rgal1]|uniref:hypothetical protein n=1 Tax=Evansella sp. AB-rgal1 TaxID=3242696 RepID=UPI00359DF371
MSNPSFIFVIASIIAVFGITICLKQLISKVQVELEKKNDISTETVQKENSRFFIKVVLVETIPILLVVYGFNQIASIEGTKELSELLPAIILIIITFIVGLFMILMARQQTLSIGDLTANAKGAVNTILFIGISLIGAIPILSIVAILMMLA